ncbi:MAG: ParB N-terminal domain-containing protein [Candidatus Hydrogenedentes bacterium]|nr:ParB N-terminal domain-containing protein [Candidatus Hydrogenedentota bacterium]
MHSSSKLSLENIRINQLKPNRYNPNRMTDHQFLALKRTIRKEGFCGAILVRRSKRGFVIVDGEHRWRAARDLGMEKAPCIIGDFNESQARALTIKMNQIHGYWSAPELVSLLGEIPDSLDELGFSDHEFTCELERALGDTSVGDEIAAQLAGAGPRKGHGGRRYVGFMLSKSQQRLLEKALKRASHLDNKDPLSHAPTR